jgi:hypothetical protein
MHINDIAKQLDVPLRRIYWVRQKLRKRFGANTLLLVAPTQPSNGRIRARRAHVQPRDIVLYLLALRHQMQHPFWCKMVEARNGDGA